MGNKSQKIEHGIQYHQRLGHIKLIEKQIDQQPQNIIQLSRSVISQKVYEEWVKQLTQISNQKAQELILQPMSHSYERQGFCGTAGLVHVELEYFPYTLKNEIKNRRNLRQFFEEEELLYLLYKTISAEVLFEAINTKIGDFSPWNIVLNEEGEIRIISTKSLPNEQTNFQRISESILSEVYLAPQEINHEAIEKMQYPPTISPIKAQLFSLAVTILEATSLEDCAYIYTRNPLKIEQEKLQKLLGQVKKKYSPFFAEVLEEMLAFDPNQRRSPQQIYTLLKPFETEILDFRQIDWNSQKVSEVKSSAFFNENPNGSSKYNFIGKY